MGGQIQVHQANGTVYAGTGVYVKGTAVGNGNPLSLSGPIRFAVDLSGVADGTTLTLDFDLLGLGAANSRVRIDDVRLRANLNSEPVAADDTVTTAEDSTLTIHVLANDTDAEGDALTPAVVTGPQHGSLTQNADGTFSYTPAANYFGNDEFTYA